VFSAVHKEKNLRVIVNSRPCLTTPVYNSFSDLCVDELRDDNELCVG
jgi:hypothetical protein